MKKRWFQFWCLLGLHSGPVLEVEELYSYATDLIAGTGIVVWGGICSRCGRYTTWESES